MVLYYDVDVNGIIHNVKKTKEKGDTKSGYSGRKSSAIVDDDEAKKDQAEGSCRVFNGF